MTRSGKPVAGRSFVHCAGLGDRNGLRRRGGVRRLPVPEIVEEALVHNFARLPDDFLGLLRQKLLDLVKVQSRAAYSAFLARALILHELAEDSPRLGICEKPFNPRETVGDPL